MGTYDEIIFNIDGQEQISLDNLELSTLSDFHSEVIKPL